MMSQERKKKRRQNWSAFDPARLWWRQSGSLKRYTKAQVFGLGARLWTILRGHNLYPLACYYGHSVTDTTCTPWRAIMDTVLQTQLVPLGVLLWTQCYRHNLYPLACYYGHSVTDTTCTPWRAITDTVLQTQLVPLGVLLWTQSYRHNLYPLARCYGHSVTRTQSVPEAKLPRGGEVRTNLQ